MQIERTRAHDAPRFEKLFVVLLVSMGLSLAAQVRSLREPIEAHRSKVARTDAPSRSRQVRKPIKAAHTGQSKQTEAARTGQAEPDPAAWAVRGSPCGPIEADRGSPHAPIEPACTGAAHCDRPASSPRPVRVSLLVSSVGPSRGSHYRYILGSGHEGRIQSECGSDGEAGSR